MLLLSVHVIADSNSPKDATAAVKLVDLKRSIAAHERRINEFESVLPPKRPRMSRYVFSDIQLAVVLPRNKFQGPTCICI